MGRKNLKFARPIRWIVALLNDKVLEFDLEGIISSNVTKGHRFLGESTIEVDSIEDYFEKLEKLYSFRPKQEKRNDKKTMYRSGKFFRWRS